MMIILMPSQLAFLQLHNTLRQDTSPSQVSTVVKPSDCLVHHSWNIFGFNLIKQEDNNDDSDADYLVHRSWNIFGFNHVENHEDEEEEDGSDDDWC